MECRLLEEPFKLVIKDGFAIFSWTEGPKIASPIRIFREDVQTCNRVLAEYDSKIADVIPIRKRAKG